MDYYSLWNKELTASNETSVPYADLCDDTTGRAHDVAHRKAPAAKALAESP